MPRLRQVSRAEAPPEVARTYHQLFGERDPVAEPGTATGTPGNWWTVWALAPAVLAHAQAGFALLRTFRITPQQRELALTRTGFARGSQFVFSQHCKAARNAGISEEKIAAIPSWSSADVFASDERTLLAYVDALVLEHGRVSDDLFARLQSILSDEAILELTYAVATYEMHATISRALRLEYDDVVERIVEIPAPGAGAAAADIMKQISR